jgi:transcription initiation factor IIF auxiliary subunit
MRTDVESLDFLLSFNLTYSTGLDVPRDEAFDHIVKLALSRTEDRPVTEKEIHQTLESTEDFPSLRRKVVEQSLKRLRRSGLVEYSGEKGEIKHLLKDDERRRIKELAQDRSSRLRNCGEALSRKVEKVYPTLTRNQREAIVVFFRKVIFDLFETFGYRCAQMVCEPSQRHPLMTSNDARDIIKKNAVSLGLSDISLYRPLEAGLV